MRYSVYDNGGATADRYTVIPEGKGWHPVQNRQGRWQYCALALNDTPTNPAFGFSQFCEAVKGRHLGRKVKFADLPSNVQAHARQRIEHDEE